MDAVQNACSAAVSDRSTVAYVAVIPGVVLLVASLACIVAGQTRPTKQSPTPTMTEPV